MIWKSFDVTTILIVGGKICITEEFLKPVQRIWKQLEQFYQVVILISIK